jgi:3-isopropylmalate/(R)-2-methylmalate dehydratase large subunit
MGMTIVEKILAKHAAKARVSPGEVVVVSVDCIAFNDVLANILGDRDLLKVADADKIVVAFDHHVPPQSVRAAADQQKARALVDRFGIRRFHDIGREQGILHTLLGERGYARPGSVLVTNDSHGCSAGAFNCAAIAIGRLDMIFAAATGTAWFRLGATVRYDLAGRLTEWTSMKDVFLHIAGTYGSHAGQNVEYGGEALAHLDMPARQTLTTMSAELASDFAVFEPDARLADHFADCDIDHLDVVMPDADASYVARRSVALDQITPMVALPDAVINNVARVEEVEGTPIQQAFIGSCANGMLDDLRVAAEIVRGRSVARGVRLIVTPASQAIYRRAAKAGYISALLEAGAVVTTATCGACPGLHSGLLGPNEVCITASTRNFKGRMGDASARIFMGSPATAAASAIAGSLIHPGNL